MCEYTQRLRKYPIVCHMYEGLSSVNIRYVYVGMCETALMCSRYTLSVRIVILPVGVNIPKRIFTYQDVPNM